MGEQMQEGCFKFDINFKEKMETKWEKNHWLTNNEFSNYTYYQWCKDRSFSVKKYCLKMLHEVMLKCLTNLQQ